MKLLCYSYYCLILISMCKLKCSNISYEFHISKQLNNKTGNDNLIFRHAGKDNYVVSRLHCGSRFKVYIAQTRKFFKKYIYEQRNS